MGWLQYNGSTRLCPDMPAIGVDYWTGMHPNTKQCYFLFGHSMILSIIYLYQQLIAVITKYLMILLNHLMIS